MTNQNRARVFFMVVGTIVAGVSLGALIGGAGPEVMAKVTGTERTVSAPLLALSATLLIAASLYAAVKGGYKTKAQKAVVVLWALSGIVGLALIGALSQVIFLQWLALALMLCYIFELGNEVHATWPQRKPGF